MEQPGFTRWISLMLALVSVATWGRRALAASDVSALHTWSQIGSPLGNGAADSLDESRAAFTTTVLSNGSVLVQVTGAEDSTYKEISVSWELAFGAGSGRPLAPGMYEGAIDCAGCISSDARPRLDLARNSSSCSSTLPASFHVRRLRRRPDGSISSLWVRFEQTCAFPSSAASGDLRFHADTSLYLLVPARIATETGRSVRVTGSVVDTRGLAATLQVIEQPEGSQVSGNGDGSITFDWAGATAPGTYRVTWVGASGDGAADTVTTLIEAFAPALFALQGPPEDPIGAGQDLRLTGADIVASGSVYSDSTARLTFTGVGHELELMLAAPYGAALRSGRYERARRTFVQQLDEAGLHVKVDGRLCDMDSASMQVRRLKRDPAGGVTDLWLTFTQRCVGASGFLNGEVRIGADTTLYIDGPAEIARNPGDPVTFPVQAFDSRGHLVVLSAVDLPAGATFVFEGSGRGTFTWPSSALAGDVTRVTFVAVADDISDTLRTTIRTFSRDVFRMNSLPGDYIGQGRNYELTPKNGQLTWQRSGSVVQVWWVGRLDTWSLNFSIPHGRGPATGFYGGPIPPGTYAGQLVSLEVETTGRGCGPKFRWFDIRRLTLGSSGEIRSLWMTFESSCSHAGDLLGEICIGDPDTTHYLEGPADVYVDESQPASYTVTAKGSLAGDAVWSVISAPPGVGLVPSGSSVAVAWTGSPLPGDYRVRLSASGSAGADTLDTWIHVPKPWSVTLQSGTQFWLSGGIDRRLRDRDGTLTCVRNDDNSISVRFTGWDFLFSIDFSRATHEPIVPGFYPVTGPSIPPYGTSPNGIYFVWNYLYPTMTSGDYTVTEATYSPSGGLLSFHATFRMSFASSISVFTGEVDFPGDVPTPTLASLVDAVWTGRSIRTRWNVPSDGEPLVLERNEGEDWRIFARVESRAGLLEQEDGNVSRGRRYGYRLADAHGSPVSDEAWITVPARVALDVHRIGPNPGSGPLRFAVSTPGGVPVALELLDVAGRVLGRRFERYLDEGTHTWALDEMGSVASGCYFVRLTSGGESRMRSVIVLR